MWAKERYSCFFSESVKKAIRSNRSLLIVESLKTTDAILCQGGEGDDECINADDCCCQTSLCLFICQLIFDFFPQWLHLCLLPCQLKYLIFFHSGCMLSFQYSLCLRLRRASMEVAIQCFLCRQSLHQP